MKKNRVVYTCITGEYDCLPEHGYVHPDWDYVCFADGALGRSGHEGIWSIREIEYTLLDDVRNQRWHKLHPHLLFPDHEASLYIDGNVHIQTPEIFDDIDRAIREGRNMSIAPHPDRNCIYDEFIACSNMGKDDESLMKTQIEMIRRDGFPEHYGMFESNIIFRKHHDETVIKIMNAWWWWIRNHSRRDQLSLTYVLWKHGYAPEPLSETSYRGSSGVSFSYSQQHVTKEELVLRIQRLSNKLTDIESSVCWKAVKPLWKIKRSIKKRLGNRHDNNPYRH